MSNYYPQQVPKNDPLNKKVGELIRIVTTRRDFKGNIWRELLARAVEKNGGYSSGYHERYALEWNVALGFGVPDSDRVLQNVFEHDNMEHTREDFMCVVPPERLEEWCSDWDDEHTQERLWSIVQESMAEGVTGSVKGTYLASIRPEIANRYGLVYHNWPWKFARRTEEDMAYYDAYKKAGWMRVEPFSKDIEFDASFELHGRSGKHLCLTEFEGRSLEMSSDKFAETLRKWDDGYSNEWCQKLLAYIAECDEMFSSKAVKGEFDYQVLYRAAQDLNDLYDECEKAQKEAAERLYWAERDVMTEAA
jgi:hypothetical protein